MSAASNHSVVSFSETMVAAKRALLHDWTPTTRSFVAWQARKYVRGMRRLTTALEGTSCRRARMREYFVEHSFPSRFCSFLLAYPPKGTPTTLAKAIARADSFTLRKPTGDTVKVRVIPKPDGGHRTIKIFTPRDRAAKMLAASILGVKWGPSPYEFSRKGRGRDAAIREALLAFKNGGVRYFVKLDLKDFYKSVPKEKLKMVIPLKAAIIRYIILVPNEAHIECNTLSNTLILTPKAVRAGLPEGSRPSALIASRLIETVLKDLPARLAISHGDDILIGVRTEAEAEATKSALSLAFAKHPAGPLPVKIVEAFQLGDGHDFLGYELVRRKRQHGGFARAKPSMKSIHRFQRRLARKLILWPKFGCEVVEDRCTRWAMSQGAWDGRHDGIGFAVIAACQTVVPLVHDFIDKMKGTTFKSFEQMQEAFDTHWLPKLPMPKPSG